MSGLHVGGVFTVTLKGLLNIIKGKVMNKLYLAVAFLVGNFVYQYFGVEPNYAAAIERSYFQVMAMLFIVWAPDFINEGVSNER